MADRVLRIGCRDSELARARARTVVDSIRIYDNKIGLELVAIKTTGDRLQEKPLKEIPGHGLFTRELEDALSGSELDLCVHNLSDMLIFGNPKLPLAAVGKRDDARDALLLRSGITILPFDSVIGSRGVHRACQLAVLYPRSTIKAVRGNTLDRVAKLDEGKVDGLILPAADVKRLGLQGRVTRYFSVGELLPAPCQGIIAVQSRKGEQVPYLQTFHHSETYDAAFAERCFVKALGDRYALPFAAYAVVSGDTLQLRGMVCGKDGVIHRGLGKGPRRMALQIGVELAVRLHCRANGMEY